MRIVAGTRLLAIALAMSAVTACQSGGDDHVDDPESAAMTDPFTMLNIARLTRLDKLTLWRVGHHAEGPGREPDEPLARVAMANDRSWAFSVAGEGGADSTNLEVDPTAPPEDAQQALVAIVEEATGRNVRAVWSSTDADTWVAKAAFVD